MEEGVIKVELFNPLLGIWQDVVAMDHNFYLTVDPDGVNNYHIKVLAQTREVIE